MGGGDPVSDSNGYKQNGRTWRAIYKKVSPACFFKDHLREINDCSTRVRCNPIYGST